MGKGAPGQEQKHWGGVCVCLCEGVSQGHWWDWMRVQDSGSQHKDFNPFFHTLLQASALRPMPVPLKKSL